MREIKEGTLDGDKVVNGRERICDGSLSLLATYGGLHVAYSYPTGPTGNGPIISDT